MLSSPHKGKQKTEELDYNNEFMDINPTITYRHLLSPVSSVRNPLRAVALCDMDAFYAACERIRLNLDPDIPLVVQQWDALIAVNYPARKFGISRMDKVKDALKRCPHLKVVHVATYKEGETEPVYVDNPDTLSYKVSLDYYRSESVKIVNIFKDSVRSGEVEKASVDEAFIDFTSPVKEEILRRYPHLAQPPPNAPAGLDTPLPPPPSISLHGLGTVVPINPPPPPPPDNDAGSSKEPENPNQDIVDGNVTETWHDVALSIAAKLMQDVRDRIRVELGYTTSAGLARNKFLAKLVASYKKHNNQTILRNSAIPNYLRPFPFQKIRFLGGKLGTELAKEYEVATVGDLLPITLEEMQSKFGEGSIWVYEILRGVDRSEVKEKSATNKSMLASKNLPQPVQKFSEGHHWLKLLSAELAHRLIKAREEMPGLWPKTLTLHISESWRTYRSKQMSFPFTQVVTGDVICNLADKLWKELLGGHAKSNTQLKIAYLGLAFHGIETLSTGQQNIHGFFQTQPTTPDVTSPKGKRKRERSNTPELRAPVDSVAKGNQACSWICPKCGERIQASLEGNASANVTEEERVKILSRLRLIHEDGHFAQALAEQYNGRASAPSSLQPSKVPRGTKQKLKQGGLFQFFDQKS